MRTGLNELYSVRSPQLSWGWELIFPRIPGVPDTRNLTIRASSTTLPGWAIDQLRWDKSGRYRHFMGKKTFDPTFSVSFLEVDTLETFRDLNAWAEFARPYEKTGGALNSEYAQTVTCVLYNEREQPSVSYDMVGAWCQSAQQLDLSQDGGLVMVQATFSLDYWRRTPTSEFA